MPQFLTVSGASALLKALVVGGLLLGVGGCDWGTTPVEEQSLVVEAFLETGRPLPPVNLRRTRPLRPPSDSLHDAASDGRVVLTLDGDSIPYEESSRVSGRYEPVVDTGTVPARVSWTLEAHWKGDTAWARGRTPPSIDVSEVCVDVPDAPARAIQVDSLRRDSLDIPADLGYIYPIDVAVRWEGQRPTTEADTSAWVRAQLRPDTTQIESGVVEVFLQSAEVRREDEFVQWTDGRQWRGVYAVSVHSATAPLPAHNLTTALVRGDTAFASFAQTRTDPDRREPISNVDGGLGVAAAVSIDSLVRTVETGLDRCRSAP